MGESFKAVIALFLIISLLATAIAWLCEQPDRTIWITRFAAPIVGVLLLVVLLKLHYRRDHVPDYLFMMTGNYFNCGGFCFAVVASVTDQVCLFHAHFQNQYDRPCVGRISLRPMRGFFLNRPPIEEIVFDVLCEEAALGVASVPVALPRGVQGREITFEVGASVKYPDGRGTRLRFRDGIHLRANARFRDSFRTIVTVLGALSGQIVTSKPARIAMKLPDEVADVLPIHSIPERQVFWKLGDPPLS